jgi:hypothetical protein
MENQNPQETENPTDDIENPDAYYERMRDMARFGCEFNATDEEITRAIVMFRRKHDRNNRD